MPKATSNPKEPVDTDGISNEPSACPKRIIDSRPKALRICSNAAESACSLPLDDATRNPLQKYII